MEKQERFHHGGGADKERFWRQQLGSLARSGETQTRFCRSKGLSRDQLQYWKRKLTESQQRVTLVELPRAAMLPTAEIVRESAPTAVVVVAHRYRVVVGAGFEAGLLSQVLDVLDSRR